LSGEWLAEEWGKPFSKHSSDSHSPDGIVIVVNSIWAKRLRLVLQKLVQCRFGHAPNGSDPFAFEIPLHQALR
jgi:hypothetical protein